MDIAPDGAILSTCDRFATLLNNHHIPEFLGGNFLGIFSRLGKVQLSIAADLLPSGLPGILDVFIQGPGAKPFVIRWIPAPRYATEIDAAGWQLTGTKVYSSTFPLPTQSEYQSPSDIHIATNAEGRIVSWNIEAEKIFARTSKEAIGQQLRELVPFGYISTTEQAVQQMLSEKGLWEGETTYVSPDGKKSYLISAIRYIRDKDQRITGVTIQSKDITPIRWAEQQLYPFDQGMFAYFRDGAHRKKQDALLALEQKALELNTGKRLALPALLNFYLKGIQEIFPGNYCLVLTLEEDDTAIVSDTAADPLRLESRDLAPESGPRACWSIPIVDDNEETVASFSVYYPTANAPADAEMELFKRAANLVTIIIEGRKAEEKLLQQEVNKQKLIARAMVDAQEKEKAEIGKELHDNINQVLSTTKLYLELARSDKKERLSLINRSAGNIQNAIRDIRNISRSLVPASIGDLGLLDSLIDLVESIRLTRALQVEFHPTGNLDERLSDRTKLMLFRVIQEQVNNVLKHSGAQKLIIELVLEETENRIELKMTDDGKGFNPEKVRKKGQGLTNIRSRADLFGGKVTILSAPGCGCQLKVQMPV